jgi:NAD(P)-dependent dehydrogenase (short-subunit alcohol dehydrogenase family)
MIQNGSAAASDGGERLKMIGSLEGRVAVITGGSAGIGRAAVELFAEADARVVFAARNADRGQAVADDLRGRGYEVVFVQADVSQATDVERLVATVVERFGRIDCAFNNAAVLGSVRRMADYSEADFDAEIGVNLKSVWLCMKYEIEQMRRQQPAGGTIVNTSSLNGLGGARGAALYSAAKAGILALTKSAAQEYASDGIRVNALVAGGFDTEMLHNAVKQIFGDDPERIAQGFKSLTARIPLGRIGNPREAAQAALWLLSDAASYVTGESMIVDGGTTCWAR